MAGRHEIGTGGRLRLGISGRHHRNPHSTTGAVLIPGGSDRPSPLARRGARQGLNSMAQVCGRRSRAALRRARVSARLVMASSVTQSRVGPRRRAGLAGEERRGGQPIHLGLQRLMGAIGVAQRVAAARRVRGRDRGRQPPGDDGADRRHSNCDADTRADRPRPGFRQQTHTTRDTQKDRN